MKFLAVAAFAAMAVIIPGAARSAAGSVTLAVSDVQTAPGSTVSIPVALNNPDDQVRGLQFTVRPSTAITYVGVHAVERGAALTAEANQQPDGSIIVVLISLGAQTIAPGSGRVLTFDLAVAPVLAGDRITLDLAEVRVAGPDGPLSNTTESGHIQIQAAPPPDDGRSSDGGGGGGGGCTLAGTAGHGSGILVALVAALLWRTRRPRR